MSFASAGKEKIKPYPDYFCCMDNLVKLSASPRVTIRKAGSPDREGRCVVYWMQRAQRGFDNSALDMAVSVANELKKPVVVFFAPVPFYPHANQRHYGFLGDGIADISFDLARRNIGFVLRTYPDHSLLKFCAEVRAAILIGDENPLRETEQWRSRVAQKIQVPFWTVDADVVVPSRLLGREHYAARTIRPRIHELLPEFLVAADNPSARTRWVRPPRLPSAAVEQDITGGWRRLDRSVSPVKQWQGGSQQALRTLRAFLRRRIADYAVQRNHPECSGTSQLSPYLHFGHIGPLTVALAVQRAAAPAATKQAFLEQLIIRRELAVNLVRFNPFYDSLACLEPWADRSFAQHAQDPRPIVYSDGQLENAETHDPLWNAAQKQMTLSGWMHNYLRMYWAKKILEWSPTVADAYRRAVYLNDRYELDGRDPNGYAGIAWAMVGKHDRPWFNRAVFGTIRYMSFASTSRKFDASKFIEQIDRMEKS
jgi:deoxyribodipyrimidine photo-lyase